MDNKPMKRCSTLVTKEVESTMRRHFTPTRMARINKMVVPARVWCGETGSLMYCWWDCKTVLSLWNAV